MVTDQDKTAMATGSGSGIGKAVNQRTPSKNVARKQHAGDTAPQRPESITKKWPEILQDGARGQSRGVPGHC